MAHRGSSVSRNDLLARIRALEARLVSRTARAGGVSRGEAAVETQIEHDRMIDWQHELEESRDRYAELFDFAPVPLAKLDRNGVIEEANLALSQLLEMEREKLVRLPLAPLVAPDHQWAFLDHMLRCRRGGARVTSQLALKTRTGRVVPVSIESRPAAGRVPAVEFDTALLDLTERQSAQVERERLEEERRRSAAEEQAARAAAETRDRFLAIVSHELRTPLTPVLFAVRKLEDDSSLSESAQDTARTIRRNVELEARLIGDLVDVSRAITGRMHLELEVVDAESLLHDVEQLCREAFTSGDVQVRFDLTASEHHVSADPARLRQVFWNLMNNAVRCTPPGGSIVIRTSNPSPGTLEVEVRDTGVGIDPAVLPEVFSPFQGDSGSRHRPGLGLGLSISRSLVEEHGGSISAESPGTGRGATFRIRLPTVAAKAAAAMPADARPAATVLVVEDNEDNASAIAEFLQASGYQVELVGSVEQAIQRAKSPFDVLVSDIGLPDGTGCDLMRRLRQDRPVRGIALSGYGSDEDVRRSREAGFEVHLTKPIDPAALLKAIDSLTHG